MTLYITVGAVFNFRVVDELDCVHAVFRRGQGSALQLPMAHRCYLVIFNLNASYTEHSSQTCWFLGVARNTYNEVRASLIDATESEIWLSAVYRMRMTNKCVSKLSVPYCQTTKNAYIYT